MTDAEGSYPRAFGSSWALCLSATGRASRFRPFSTTVPKEMLPLGTRRALDHVIDECTAAGASEIIVVTRPADTVVTAHLAAKHARVVPVHVVALSTYWSLHPEDTP